MSNNTQCFSVLSGVLLLQLHMVIYDQQLMANFSIFRQIILCNRHY